MKTTSDGFKALAEDEYGVKYYHKITLNGTEITEDINDFKYSHTCNGEDTLTIGNVGSAMVKFSINRPSINLANEEIEVFEGIDVNGTIEYVKLGIFKVLKPTNDRGNTTYQCVDRMTYLMNMPFFSELTDNVTDVAILNEICTQVGIALANTDLISHTLPSAPIGYTRREVISYMSQLQGKNAIINNEGNLELIWYSQTDYVVDDDKIYYEGTDSINGEMDYILEYIECIVRKEEEEVSLKSGNGIVGMSFENPFMTQEILDEVFARIGGFTYRPVEVQFLGDFRLEVGDIVTVTTNNSSYIVPIMEITHDSDGGVKTTIQSIAETESENGLDLSSPSTKAMDRYYANLVLINKALVNKLDVDQLDAVAAEIQRLVVNEIDGKYAEIDFANIDTAKVDKNIVSLLLAEVGLIDRATIVEGHVTKLLDAVEINANSIKSGTIVTDRLLLSGAEGSILFELNNLGELTSTNVDSLDGYVITPRTINADRIVAGSITANEIDVEKLIADTGFINTLTSSEAFVINLVANDSFITNLTADTAFLGNLSSNQAFIESIFANDITATGTITGAKIIGSTIQGSTFYFEYEEGEVDYITWLHRGGLRISRNEYNAVYDSVLSERVEINNEGIVIRTVDDEDESDYNVKHIQLLKDIVIFEVPVIIRDTFNVTGATTLESTLNVKGNTIVGDSTATTYKGCYVQNSYRYGGLHASEGGNLGFIDFGNNRWLIYQDSNGVNYIPSRTLVTGYIKNTGGNIIIGTNNNFLYGVSTAGSEYQLIGLNSSNQCDVAPTLANVVIGKAATNITIGKAGAAGQATGVTINDSVWINPYNNIVIKNNNCGLYGVKANTTNQYVHLIGVNTSNECLVGGDSALIKFGGRIQAGGGIEIQSASPYIDFHWNNSTSDYNVRLSNSESGVLLCLGHFAPSADNTYNLGYDGKRWKQLYAKTSTISTSDRNLKTDIKEFDERYDIFYDLLKSCSFKFIDGETGRSHSGFISQDVEEALSQAGLTALDFAGFCKDIKKKKVVLIPAEYDENGNIISEENYESVDDLDENGNLQYTYSLRYEEFIALNTNQIQKLKTRVNTLEEENRELRETINNVLLRLQVLEERG